jgi:hypothetical protein
MISQAQEKPIPMYRRPDAANRDNGYERLNDGPLALERVLPSNPE